MGTIYLNGKEYGSAVPSGVFIDTNKVIKAETTYSTATGLSYTATEDCAVFVSVSMPNSGKACRFLIDGVQLYAMNSESSQYTYQNVIFLKAAQTLTSNHGIDPSAAKYTVYGITSLSDKNSIVHSYTATLTSNSYGWFTLVDENGNTFGQKDQKYPILVSSINSGNYYVTQFLHGDNDDTYIFKAENVNQYDSPQILRTASSTITFKIVYVEYTTSSKGTVNYSTSEHTVGTWIDGSTVYEKTLTFTISDFHNSGDMSSSRMNGQLWLDQDYDNAWIQDGWLLYKNAPYDNATMFSTPLNYAGASGTYIRSNIQKSSGVNDDKPYIYCDITYSVSAYYRVRNNLIFIYVIRYTKASS